MKPEPLNAGRAREIAGLCGLSRADLVERWVGLHGTPPMKTMTEGLLARGIAYELQVRQLGGLTPAEMKALGALAQGRPNPSPGVLKAGRYLAGVFWFAFYDMVIQADWNVVSVIEYGATWPLRLLSLV